MAEVAYIGPNRRERRPRPLLRTMIGDVLRRTRLEQGRTLADVARAARVSMPYLSEVERGRKEASSEVLAAVCDALRIDLAEVVHAVGRDLATDRPAAVRGQRAPQVIRAPQPARGTQRLESVWRAESAQREAAPVEAAEPVDATPLAEAQAYFRPAPSRRRPVPPPRRRGGDVVLLAA